MLLVLPDRVRVAIRLVFEAAAGASLASPGADRYGRSP